MVGAGKRGVRKGRGTGDEGRVAAALRCARRSTASQPALQQRGLQGDSSPCTAKEAVRLPPNQRVEGPEPIPVMRDGHQLRDVPGIGVGPTDCPITDRPAPIRPVPRIASDP